jgi:membrane protein
MASRTRKTAEQDAGGSPADRPPGSPGERAEAPSQIPMGGWWQVVRRAVKESSADNVPILAAGVAFYAFLAVPPALIATITLYGLVADPEQVTQQIEGVAGALPEETQPLIAEQLSGVAGAGSGALGIGLVVSLLVALWSASTGTATLITAVNIAYDEEETRGFVRLRAIALALTLGAIVFVLLAVALVVVVPPLLDALQLGAAGTIAAQVLRWVLLVLVVTVALAVVYKLAPDRENPRFSWTSPGAVVATVLWILGSIGFSIYMNNFGNYNETYGALAGVVIFMLWLFLTSYIVLLGAEINNESERQTGRDTTTGEPEPMGERGAVGADTVVAEERDR